VASKQLMRWRKRAHQSFDRLWQQGHMQRFEAYEWLRVVLARSATASHIAMLSKDDCKTVVRSSEKKMQEYISATADDT